MYNKEQACLDITLDCGSLSLVLFDLIRIFHSLFPFGIVLLLLCFIKSIEVHS
jgi:hypothetical protein